MNRSTNIADPTKACEFLQLAKSLLAAGGSNKCGALRGRNESQPPRYCFPQSYPRQLDQRLGCRPDRYDRLWRGPNAVASILAQMPSVHNKTSGGEGRSQKSDAQMTAAHSVTYFLFVAMIFKQNPV